MVFVLYPLTTEKAVAGIEKENKLTFVIAEKATKADVKKELEAGYGEKVSRVTVLYALDGRKKAIVRFAREKAASDLAVKLKMV